MDYRSYIYTIKTILNKHLLKKKHNVNACFVNFSKAFDTVRRSGLFKKLLDFGRGGIFTRLSSICIHIQNLQLKKITSCPILAIMKKVSDRAMGPVLSF